MMKKKFILPTLADYNQAQSEDGPAPTYYCNDPSHRLLSRLSKTWPHESDHGVQNHAEWDGRSAQGHATYAELIYRALMDTPGHRLVLQDIYDWIIENTDKAINPNFTGWQGTVRHNLSMNAVRIKDLTCRANNNQTTGV